MRVYTLKSEAVSGSTVPACRYLHVQNCPTGDALGAAFATSRPAQEVIRIKAINITFIELRVLRSTIIYCKAYKDI